MNARTECSRNEDTESWANAEGTEVPKDLPQPAWWRILVLPVKPPKASRGGIIIPAQAREAEEHLQQLGRVAALGPLAGRSWKFASDPLDYLRILCGLPVRHMPAVGDWVVFNRYTGQRMEYKGTRLILMNDDELLCKAQSAEGFKIHI